MLNTELPAYFPSMLKEGEKNLSKISSCPQQVKKENYHSSIRLNRGKMRKPGKDTVITYWECRICGSFC